MADKSIASSKSIAIESIDDLREPIAKADIDIVPLGPANIRGSLLQANIGEIAFSIGKFSTPLRAVGVFHSNNITMGLVLEGSETIRVWGVESKPGNIIWVPPGGDHDIRHSSNTQFAALSIRPDSLAGLLSSEGWLGDAETWMVRNLCHLPPSQNLGRQLEHLAQIVSQQPDLPRATYDYLSRCVVEAFTASLRDSLPQPSPAIPSTTRIVREAEQYLENQNFRPIHLSELCSTLNISRRTLHRAFEDVTGLAPALYVRHKRLSHVHSKLLTGDPRVTRVTDVALEFGFTEFGRFSQYYRDIFGELPSETLRQ